MAKRFSKLTRRMSPAAQRRAREKAAELIVQEVIMRNMASAPNKDLPKPTEGE